MTTVIEDSHLMVFASPMGLPMASPYELVTPNNFVTGGLNIAEAKLVEFSQMSVLASEGELSRVLTGNHLLYVIGYVRYRDEGPGGVMNNVAWRVAFARKWDPASKRFVRIEDPDYEYES
jgi:hypothetical protein